MCNVTISMPDDAMLALKVSPEGLAGELRIAAAMKLYELGRLSSGAAAAVAGVPRPVFLSKLADYGITTFRLSEAELREDLRRA